MSFALLDYIVGFCEMRSENIKKAGPSDIEQVVGKKL